jgi:hypothetical protein
MDTIDEQLDVYDQIIKTYCEESDNCEGGSKPNRIL